MASDEDSSMLEHFQRGQPEAGLQEGNDQAGGIPRRSIAEQPQIGDPGSFHEFPVALLSSPLHRAAVALDFGAVGALDVRAASVRGQGHRYARSDTQHAVTRQDEYGVGGTTDGRWLVTVVADGVSNTRTPHRAAVIASRVGVRIIVQALEDGVPATEIPWANEVAPAVSSAIVRDAARAAGTELPPDEIPPDLLAELQLEQATTAIAAIIATEPSGGADAGAPVRHFPYVVANLAGDSSAFVLSVGGWSDCDPRGPDVDKHDPSAAVQPLPAGDGDIPYVASGVLEAGDALFLMSDGLAAPLGSGTGQVGAHLAMAWNSAPSVYRFAAELDFYRRGFDDDRTCVGIWPE